MSEALRISSRAGAELLGVCRSAVFVGCDAFAEETLGLVAAWLVACRGAVAGLRLGFVAIGVRRSGVGLGGSRRGGEHERDGRDEPEGAE